MAFLDKKITELAYVSTPGQDDRIAIVNLGVTKQTSVDKFLQSVVSATGSFIEDATIADNIITFTRADGTTFDRTIESSSYAVSSSFSAFSLDALSSSFATSASFALFANDAISSSYAVTSSYSLAALSASFADFATSASYAITASHALNVPETASYSITSSYSLKALSASFAEFVESASYAVTASHALNVPETASYALTASFLDAPVVSASYALTASHALNVPDTASNADTASRVNNDLTNGLGVEVFTFNGSTDAQVQVDTSSAHFLDPINAATASLSSSASTSRDTLALQVSGAFDAVSASLTTTDQTISSSVTALSQSAATALDAVSSSAATDIVTNSASIAALSQSAAAERLNFVETSSVIGLGNIIEFTKGDNSTYTNTIITSSFVKSVNGILPTPSTGNVNTSLTAVSTGTSASMLAASSSGTLDNGEVWIISGQTGGDPISGSGSNGEAYIFDSGSGQLFKLANNDQAENDARYVLKFGDTMTGNLVLPSDPTLPLEASTKQYVDRAYISSSIVGSTLSLFTGTTPATEHSHSITDAISASYAVSASHSEFADSSSYALTSSKAISASYAISASHVEFADSASYAVTSSHAITASFVNNTYRENVAGDVRYTITHNLSEQYPVVQTYDTATNRQLIPDFIESTGINTLDIEYAVTFSGIVIVQK